MSAAGIDDAVPIIAARAVALMQADSARFPDADALDTPQLRGLVEAVARALLERLEARGDATGALLNMQEEP